MTRSGPDTEVDTVDACSAHHQAAHAGTAATIDQSTRLSERRYRALVQTGRSLVWFAAPDGSITRIWGWDAFCGEGADGGTADSWVEALHPDDRSNVLQTWHAAIATGHMQPIEARMRKRDGSYRWAQTCAVTLRDAAGAVIEWVGTVTDVHDRKEAEQAVRKSEEMLLLALEATGLGLWRTNLDCSEIHASPRAQAIVDIHRDGPFDLDTYFERVHPDYHEMIRTDIVQNSLRIDGKPFRHSYRLLPDAGGHARVVQSMGRLTLDANGTPFGFVGTLQDITEQTAAVEALKAAANHDALTGLINRRALHVELDRAIQRATPNQTRVALLLIDLDEFKDVNDTLGHDAGDGVLIATAARLTAVIDKRGCVARLGGDEFAIVIDHVNAVADAMDLGAQILHRLDEPLVHRDKKINLKASIGIACYPDHDATCGKLFKDADLALYAAKNAGRHQVRLYDESLRLALEQRTRCAADIRDALDARQIIPFYQAKIDLTTGAIRGFEALARWNHPERGVLTPEAFAIAFEDSHLGMAIDDAIMRQVVKDMADWHRRGLAFGRIAVNVCAASLGRPGIVDHVRGLLASYPLPPHCFELEITESVFLDDGAHRIPDVLRRLRESGIRISLDDFGTGYASLTHLKRFPVDELKIDRSFVRDILEDPDDAAIVSAVITLGRCLSLKTIAEGIESQGQAVMLKALGCDAGQGYLYGRPMPAHGVVLRLGPACPPDHSVRADVRGDDQSVRFNGQGKSGAAIGIATSHAP